MRIPVCSVLAASVVLACAQAPAPASLNPTPTIALGDAAHFGPGVIASDDSTVWFELAKGANVRLVHVGEDASVSILARGMDRRASGTHRAVVVGSTGVHYSRQSFSPVAVRTPSARRGIVGVSGHDCGTAYRFAALYARNRQWWAIRHENVNDPASPAAFNPWIRPAQSCQGFESVTPGWSGASVAVGGYWLLIATDRPLALEGLDAVLTTELGELGADELVRALPQSLVTAEAPGARWAAYAVAR